MTIAVLGAAPVNGLIQEVFHAAGLTVAIWPDLDSLRDVVGQKGAFHISGADRTLDAAYIILAESSAGPLTCRYSAPGARGPDVFLLDHPAASGPQAARAALEEAAALAAKKRRVVYLARQVQTSGDDLELLYRDARRQGVTFFKYDAVSVGEPGDDGLIPIRAQDGPDVFTISAASLTVAAAPTVDGVPQGPAEPLHVRPGEGKFFLFPALTSRKGVYRVTASTSSGGEAELLAQVQFILSDIRRDVRETARAAPGIPAPAPYAIVDAEKCAFCYTCYRACPHFALRPDDQAAAMECLPASCTGCGICAGLCPANAITMAGPAAPDAAQASLALFCCENSGAPALRRIEASLAARGVKLASTELVCGGQLSAERILAAAGRADHVLVAVCQDAACRHFEGNRRARRQVERARELLGAAGLDKSRVTLIELSCAMPQELDRAINECFTAKEYGENDRRGTEAL